MTDLVTIYEPDNMLRKGYLRILPAIARELYSNRWLTFQLFKRDFTATFKQSFGGYIYILLGPLLGVATFVLLSNSGVFNIGDVKVPYPIYAIMGTAFWQLFATGITAGAGSLIAAGPMISKINFSKKSLVLASAGQCMVSFLIQFVLVVLLFALYRKPPSMWILMMPLMTLPVLLLGVGLAFALAVFNAMVRDVGTMLGSFLSLLMFLTPVMYAKPHIGILSKATQFNPLYYLVATPRELILRGTLKEPVGYFTSVGVAVAVFMVCLVVFHLTEARVAERI